MDLELAIIVLNYRTAQLTADCLDSLRAEITPRIRVLVVDNASRDGSAERIEAHIAARDFGAWARVLRSPINGGFAAGNNLGIREVSARAYMLLNSDTLVRPGAVRELLRVSQERPDVGMVGPSFVDGGGHPLDSCFTFPHPMSELLRSANTGLVTRALRRFETPARHGDSPLEPDWMPFACVVIRREVIDVVGLLDDGYFMYFEDVDYCLKLRAAGWTLLYWPNACVVHLVGGSSDVTAKGAARKRAPRYYYEARARFFTKHFGPGGMLLANAAWMAGRTVSLGRQLLLRTPPPVREHEGVDIWRDVLHPFRPSRSLHAAQTGSQSGSRSPSDASPHTM